MLPGMRILQVWLLAMMLGVAAAQGSVLDELDASQREDLRSGRVVVRSEAVPGAAWPRLIVYTKVRAPVSTVEEVLRDYASAPNYIPGMVSAEVLEQPDADTYMVRYTSMMPVVGQSRSTVRNRYSRDGEALVMTWTLIEATHALASDGGLQVEPDGRGGSFLRYANHVVPKSSLAALAKPAAVAEVKKTVEAIRKESERRN